MIKINLATRKTSAVAPGASGEGSAMTGMLARYIPSLAGGGGGAGAAGSMFQELPIKRIAILTTVAIGAYFALESYKSSELEAWDAKLAEQAAKTTKLKKELNETKKYDETRKQIEANELLVRTKIETIEKLVFERQAPPKMMLALSASIPADVWLRDLQVNGDEIKLHGLAASFGQVTEFLSKLKESAYFRDPAATGTSAIKDEKGLDAVDFSIQARRWGKSQ